MNKEEATEKGFGEEEIHGEPERPVWTIEDLTKKQINKLFEGLPSDMSKDIVQAFMDVGPISLIEVEQGMRTLAHIISAVADGIDEARKTLDESVEEPHSSLTIQGRNPGLIS